MSKIDKLHDLEIDKQKAVLIGVCLRSEAKEEKETSLEELGRLADTAGLEVIGSYLQKRNEIKATTFAGKGFLEEIVNSLPEDSDTLLIFDTELTPLQNINLAKKFELPIADRTNLIIDIFSSHAQTHEARLQVRLAKLKYQLPRLKRMWSHLDRERGTARGSGGNSGGAGGTSRGMGEKQIEMDKRKIRDEIHHIQKHLKKIMTQKESQRKERQKAKKVCLVGYTNAGKSTLFNYLTNAGVLQEDKLFATLGSTARSLNLGKGKDIVISDTVGFIADLPHNLVASFRATLKDVLDADLLLHVVDVSSGYFKKQILEVEKVLKQIDADIPQIFVLNKVDKIDEDKDLIEFVDENYPKSVYISAKTGTGVEKLIYEIDHFLNYSRKYTFFIPHSDQKPVNFIHKYGKIIFKEFENDGIRIKAELNKSDVGDLEKYIVGL